MRQRRQRGGQDERQREHQLHARVQAVHRAGSGPVGIEKVDVHGCRFRAAGLSAGRAVATASATPPTITKPRIPDTMVASASLRNLGTRSQA